jgi:hypothetical protein
VGFIKRGFMNSVEWSDKYPHKKVLREEINCMLEAYIEALFEVIPESEIAGIYFKGSAKKEWDSLIDYVPEISDVDIHLLFREDSLVEKYFHTIDNALSIQSNVERKYFSKVSNPIHIPRPQLVILNPLLKEEDFVPSPKNTISILFGEEYPKPVKKVLGRLSLIDYEHLINEEEFVNEFSLHIVDRPSKYLWQGLRNLVWHISPIGSRILSIKGKSYQEAWGINRTGIVESLKLLGEEKLVDYYTKFYINGWDYFLSHYKNTDRGRKAIAAGINALKKAIEIAKPYREKFKK